MNRELSRRKQLIWTKYERNFGHPINPVLRSTIENTICPGAWDSIAISDLDDSIPTYLKIIAAAGRMEEGTVFRPKDTRKRYSKCFQNQLYLVNFVAMQFVTIENWAIHSFRPHSRINWRKVFRDWNKKHPYDFTDLKVLKVKFYRAIGRDDIRREFFSQADNTLADWMAWLDYFTALKNLPKTEVSNISDPGLKLLVEGLQKNEGHNKTTGGLELANLAIHRHYVRRNTAPPF